jgi:hypothetical protein
MKWVEEDRVFVRNVMKKYSIHKAGPAWRKGVRNADPKWSGRTPIIIKK